MKAPRAFKRTLTFVPASLSVGDMFDLHAGLGTTLDVISGLLCQPRFVQNAPDQRVLHSLWQMVASMRRAIRDEASVRSPSTNFETARLVAFAAETWVDGSANASDALKGLGEALARLVEKDAEGSAS